MYYLQDGYRVFVIKPEIGIGTTKLHLKYGYAFAFASNNLTGLARHTITLSCYVSFLKDHGAGVVQLLQVFLLIEYQIASGSPSS
jgi:hypothetical protein